ncbi:hypothetical protein [Halomontanus rarus]|uniref:hypothetical protein n=1 Tax=Halomontanus rarus TaxID=3034020 RepID=UPI0023E7C067|nr:hypothetical protein [Halovivax sp. TS33]
MFDRLVWHNPHVCNGYFEHVKDVDEYTPRKSLDVQEHHRTEHATLEQDTVVQDDYGELESAVPKKPAAAAPGSAAGLTTTHSRNTKRSDWQHRWSTASSRLSELYLESVAQRERWWAAEMSIGNGSSHIERDTWSMWAPFADVGPSEAWAGSQPIHYPSAGNGCVARLYRRTDTVLLA